MSKKVPSTPRFNMSDWALNHQTLVLYLMLVITITGLFSYTQDRRAHV